MQVLRFQQTVLFLPGNTALTRHLLALLRYFNIKVLFYILLVYYIDFWGCGSYWVKIRLVIIIHSKKTVLTESYKIVQNYEVSLPGGNNIHRYFSQEGTFFSEVSRPEQNRFFEKTRPRRNSVKL